jgi:hypothetical protein
MKIAKLSDGKIGRVIKEGAVAFAKGTHLLMSFPVDKDPYGFGSNKTTMMWVRDTRVVYKLDIGVE